MSLLRKNRGQLRNEVALNLGLNNDFDTTTGPPLSLANQYIDDSIREILSPFTYNFLYAQASYPFWHTINNVQGVFLSGFGSGVSTVGGITPYPFDALNIGVSNIDSSLASFSGISFNGYNATSGLYYPSVSVSGYLFNTGVVSLVGQFYELNPDVEKIIGITTPNNSLPLTPLPPYSLMKRMPLGAYAISGVPFYYTEFPGLSASGNISVEFLPSPAATQSGINFTVWYKRMHLSMQNDTDVQRVIPTQFQDIIVKKTLQKCFEFLNDPKAELYAGQVEARANEMQLFAETFPDYVAAFRDMNEMGAAGGLYNTNDAVAFGNLIW